MGLIIIAIVANAVNFFLLLIKKSDADNQLKKCVIYVAEKYQGWMEIVLLKLKELYSESENTLPDSNEIFQSLKTVSELSPYLKKVMPFVQMLKDNLSIKKAATLDIVLPFNEKSVLQAHEVYLASTLKVKFLVIILIQWNGGE